MQEEIEVILERVPFEKKDKFAQTLSKCIKVSVDSKKRTNATYDNLVLYLDILFEGVKKVLNEIPAAKKFSTGMETIKIVFNELSLEIEDEDAFLIYHLRDLGKFKIRDSKLLEELKIEWKTHKEFVLDDQEFARTLKVLMRMGILDYRKGNLTLKKEVLIRYKD